MIEETLVSPNWLSTRLGNVDVAVVDCRFSLADTRAGQIAYAAEHIPGAVYAHLDRDLSDPVVPGVTGRHPLPTADDMALRLGRMGIDENVQVVAYDDAGGTIAARLWWHLHYLGHSAAAVLDGGWQSWVSAGLPTTAKGPESRASRRFLPRPRPELLASTDDVLNIVDHLHTRRAPVLLDARSADRYAGRNETIDPVAGHIAGAISAPYSDNLDASGRMLPPAQLRRRFEAHLSGADPSRVTAYCGSGVTAAHLILAMRHAGLGVGDGDEDEPGGPRLYAGSWSEWITDPKRPIALDQVPDRAVPPLDAG